MDNIIFKRLVSPKTGLPLRHRDNKLVTDNGEEFFLIHDGIACLLEPDTLDSAKLHEINVFDHLHIQDVAYYREKLFQAIGSKISSILKQDYAGCQKEYIFAEMGGGEGHWARYIKRKFPQATVFVCDISMKTLGRAPKDLQPVCADITRPVFEKKSVRAIAFWVSLHHLEQRERQNALREAADSLEEGGILLVFEPNKLFLPRDILYKTRLGKDVYADEKEQAIDFSEISSIVQSVGLAELGIYFVNPPYNHHFVKKMRRWLIYMTVVEFLYQIDKWILNPVLGSIFSKRQSPLKKYLSLYGLAIYKKEKV